jgi:hypothetical protein
MRLLRIAPLALLLAFVPLAACGGDDDDGGGGGDALTKAEFIEQGDAICEAASDDGEDLEEPDAEDAEDLSRFLGDAIEVIDGARQEFEDLDPPADGEEVYELEVEALRDSVEVLEDAKAAADDDDVAEARRIVTEADPEADAREPLQEYGFEVCGVE